MQLIIIDFAEAIYSRNGLEAIQFVQAEPTEGS